MKKTIPIIVSILLVSVLFFLVKGERESRPGLRPKGDACIEGLRIVNKKDGRKNWTLKAKRADLTENGNAAFLTDLEMELEDRGITVCADKGVYNMNSRDLTLESRIVAKGKSYSITSDRAEFDNKAGNLKTDGPVRLDGKRFSVQGREMFADAAAQTVRIQKDVKAIFYH